MGAGPVRHVHHEHVSDLEQPRFDGLDAVAQPRHRHDDDGISDLHDFEFDLTDTDGFHEDDVASERVERPDDVTSRGSEAAGVSARCHASDEDAGVTGMALHANAIAENCAASVRARRIYRNDADRLSLRPDDGGEPVDKGALAGAG